MPSVASEATTPAFKPSLPNPARTASSSGRTSDSPFDALLDADAQASAQPPPPPDNTAQAAPADSPQPPAKSSDKGSAKSQAKDGDAAKTANTDTPSNTADAGNSDPTATGGKTVSSVEAKTGVEIHKQTATGDDSKPAGNKPASDSKPADGLTPAIHTALLANNSAQAVISVVALITAPAAAPVTVPQAIAATALQAAVAATESAKGTPANLTAVKADVAEPVTDSNASAKTTSVSKGDGKPQPATVDADKLVTAPSHDEAPATGHHAATAEVAPPAIPPDAQAAVPKTFADAAQQAALTAPPQDVTQTAANPVAAAQLAPQALAVPLAGIAIEIAGKALEGKNRFEIRLDPPELGRIEVRLDVDRDGNAVTRLIADRSDTLDLLRRDANNLQQALQDAGLKTSDNGLQFSLRDQTMGRDQSNTPMPAAAQIVIKDDTLPAADISPRNYPRLAGLGGGIDIRV
ncbi:MAG TPA: flagellar hook-length control protein FliK [Pseudolabrys sp.]